MEPPERGDTPADSWRLAAIGDRGLLLIWRGDASAAGASVRAAARLLGRLAPPGQIELVPGIDSLLVCYDPLLIAPGELRRHVAPVLARGGDPQSEVGRLVEIPVSYGGTAGPDLGYVAHACGLSEAAAIALHTARAMPVLMLGFMPGFPYIGELPAELRLPRRAEPRVAVPAGAVALANDQTGIYPSRSPGGWHIIGRTEARLFDPARDPPALLRAGDRVRFVAVGEL